MAGTEATDKINVVLKKKSTITGLISSWMGDEETVAEVETEQPTQRPMHLGIGAKYVPQPRQQAPSKAERDLKRSIEQSKDKEAVEDSEEEEEEGEDEISRYGISSNNNKKKKKGFQLEEVVGKYTKKYKVRQMKKLEKKGTVQIAGNGGEEERREEEDIGGEQEEEAKSSSIAVETGGKRKRKKRGGVKHKEKTLNGKDEANKKRKLLQQVSTDNLKY